MKKIIFITAIWCPSCLLMRPRYQELVKLVSKFEIQEIDYDDNPQLIKKYRVGTTLPVAIIIDQHGQELNRFIGEISKKKLLDYFGIS